MTNKYRIRSIAFVAILTCGMASAQQLRDTFRRVKSGVVVVRSVDPEHATSGPMSQVDEDGLGSGVLIST
ncbi:MAG: hypothetical protein ND866_17105, partial [Pyrinomonadaceae bacterium]|nr:hypothetical protein [Pyrinomonadaceae bacterium]